jgi:hypothetical protein
MNIPKIFIAGITGTSLMTVFSYQVSQDKKEQFREPLLLHKLISRLLPPKYQYNPTVDGWTLHYSVGLMFNVVYDALWQRMKSKPSLANGMLTGAISGLIGASIWKIILKLPPNPPAVDVRKYYYHLVAAHIVFGVFSAMGYRAVPERNQNNRSKQIEKFNNTTRSVKISLAG